MPDPATILLVEDNPDDEALTVLALRAGVPANIEVARDGQEAIDYLVNDHTDLPRLVLLDLKLPKIDGLEVLRRIREGARTCLTPVVVLTNSNAPSDVAASYRLRANSYVRKPVDFAAFSETVRQLGSYWLWSTSRRQMPSTSRGFWDAEDSGRALAVQRYSGRLRPLSASRLPRPSGFVFGERWSVRSCFAASYGVAWPAADVHSCLLFEKREGCGIVMGRTSTPYVARRPIDLAKAATGIVGFGEITFGACRASASRWVSGGTGP